MTIAAITAAVVVVAIGATGSELLLPGAELRGSAAWLTRLAAGLAAALGLATLVARSRWRSPAGGRRRPGPFDRPRWALVAAVVIMGVLFLASLPFSPNVSVDPATTTASAGEDAEAGDAPEDDGPRELGEEIDAGSSEPDDRRGLEDVLGDLLPGLALAAVLGAAGLGVMVLQGRLPWRSVARPDVTRVPDALLDAQDTAAGLGASLDAVGDVGEPRQRIAAAYGRLLQALADAGAPRRRHEAPHEHLHRVLDPLGVRPEPLHRLAELFVLARFSPHPLTEKHLAAAIDALETSLADLRLAHPAGAVAGLAPAASAESTEEAGVS